MDGKWAMSLTENDGRNVTALAGLPGEGHFGPLNCGSADIFGVK
jgi:hypothetical protein